jgi:uncharacterized protein YxeA
VDIYGVTKGRKKMAKKIVLIVVALMMICSVAFMTTGCREADRVSYNVSQDADNFNVMRRLAVINTVDGKPVFE